MVVGLEPIEILEGKKAVVVGGSRGFGRGVVEALAAKGMHVLAISRDRDSLSKMASEVSERVDFLAGDVRDPTLAVDVIQGEFPDVLVLSAGSIVPIQDVHNLTWEAFSINWDVDLRGTFLWTREALLAPLSRGSVALIVSSTAAGSDSARIVGYVAAKTAQIILAKALAQEAAPLGIRVHYLLPTLTTETDLGSRSARIFARRAGSTEQEILEGVGHYPPLRPETFGQAVVQILTDPELTRATGYRISETTLDPLGEDRPILLP